ncbi:GNAT family N-acetyltransferase [Knoellia sp. CPCC 206450]|uniref:GNAT family N-acetyltransferase n=1 Tax=Knoellia tibetensis TaxID=3404798 RepID=UPI003B43028E
MTETAAARRQDPYRNFTFRVIFEGRPVAGAETLSGLEPRNPSQQDPSPQESSPEPTGPALVLEDGVSFDPEFVRWAVRWVDPVTDTQRDAPERDLHVEVRDERGRTSTAYRVMGGWVAEFVGLPDPDADAHAVQIEHLRLEHAGIEPVPVTPTEPTEQYGVGGRPRRHPTVTLRPIGEDWRAVADVVPTDAQRAFVYPMAARYMLTNEKGGPWTSLGIHEGDTVVGHVMWGLDDDGSHWIGGVIIDRSAQGRGLGRAAMEALIAWLREQPGHWVTRLTHHPDNVAAARLYADLGFTPTGETDEDGEIVLELRP